MIHLSPKDRVRKEKPKQKRKVANKKTTKE